MTHEPDLAQLSYQAHERGYDDYGPGSSKAGQAQAWLDQSSVNSWRFERMYDYYLPGVELEPAQESSALFRRFRARIAHYDRLCRLGINQWGLLGALMLKDNPNEALRSALQRHGYELTVLPANPYLKGRPR